VSVRWTPASVWDGPSGTRRSAHPRPRHHHTHRGGDALLGGLDGPQVGVVRLPASSTWKMTAFVPTGHPSRSALGHLLPDDVGPRPKPGRTWTTLQTMVLNNMALLPQVPTGARRRVGRAYSGEYCSDAALPSHPESRAGSDNSRGVRKLGSACARRAGSSAGANESSGSAMASIRRSAARAA